jgi:hypothetical protein
MTPLQILAAWLPASLLVAVGWARHHRATSGHE